MKMNYKVTVVTNSGIMIATIILAVIFLSGSLVGAYFAWQSDQEGAHFAAFFLGFCGLVMPTVMLIEPERYFVWLTFTPTGIEYHTVLRKKKVHSYAEYPYILRGGYLHAGIPVEYIVMTNRRLKDDELYNINHVKPSSHLIRIQYSKKMFRKLVEVLPPRQRSMLLQAFHTHKAELEQ